MNTIGNTALKPVPDPKHEMMEEYLSAENGYWLEEDIWRTDSEAYKTSGIKESRRDGTLADFTGYPDLSMKLEIKYYLLYALKNKWTSPVYVQDMLVPVIRLIGRSLVLAAACESFAELGQDIYVSTPEDTAPTVAALYTGFLNKLHDFFADYYDDREETEKDVWYALKIPGVKLSAAMKREHPSMNFRKIPEVYRDSVKRFMKRLVIRVP